MKRPELTDLTSGDWDKYYSKQGSDYGGYCPDCGDGVKPLLNNDIESFGLCEYSGNHPDCGDHDMVFTATIPDTFGGYEVWECRNGDCDYKEAL